MEEIQLRQNHINAMTQYLAKIETQLTDLSAWVRLEIRTLLDDVKNSKTQLEQTQTQVTQKTGAVEEKQRQHANLQNSPEMNSFRDLKLDKISLERRIWKWMMLKEPAEPYQKTETLSIANAQKRKAVLEALKKAEDELIRKREEDN
jgi:hypothetical protein